MQPLAKAGSLHLVALSACIPTPATPNNQGAAAEFGKSPGPRRARRRAALQRPNKYACAHDKHIIWVWTSQPQPNFSRGLHNISDWNRLFAKCGLEPPTTRGLQRLPERRETMETQATGLVLLQARSEWITGNMSKNEGQ